MLKIDISDRVLHFRQPAGTSRGIYKTRHCCFVTIRNNETEGVGECAPLPDLSCDSMSSSAEYTAVLRKFCDEVEQTGRIPYEQMRPYPSMLFGLETAMAQLAAGGSTALFDTPFARGEEGIPMNGLVWMGSFEEMYTRLEEKLRQGFHCVKLKIGAIDFERELDLVRHIRKTFTK